MDSAPELREAFAAMTPELWELIPLVLDPAHLDCTSSGGGSQPLSLGPGGSMDGRVARAGPGRHDSAGIDSREGCMALPRVPSIAAGTRVVAATSSTDPPHSQCGEQQRKWRKRKRNLYSWNQLHILESFFHREKYPNLPQAEMLSGMTGLTYQQIRIWFQNRRGKHRRLYAGDRTPGSSLCTLQMKTTLMHSGTLQSLAHPCAVAGSTEGAADPSREPNVEPGARKRNRHQYSELQLSILTFSFERQLDPAYGAIIVLAQALALTEKQVKPVFPGGESPSTVSTSQSQDKLMP
ncbi:hypothetical protein KIL84_018343 [Mauremys mutica]|uniref:Homeobox domain-containing protein n=1 Tax=Mauremys mutica TaxID=74926 RepID=A0A9D4BA49_9SAUR|nr:hypothetical protein KIL84_018343 [Mauremys mutica]